MNYDVVVIGAGVIGTACSYYLVKKGYKVALVDKGDIAGGTSSHCDAAAMITDKMPGPDADLGYASIQNFKKLHEDLSHDFEFRQDGSLQICESEEEMQAATKYVADLQKSGYRVRMVDSKEMADIEPYLAKDLKGGFWCDEDCGLNPFRLCFAFVDEVKGKGLDVYTFNEVTDIKLDKNKKVQAVETKAGTLNTNHVVNAAGCWSPEIAKMVGIKLPVQPRKGVVLITEATVPLCHQKVQEFGYMFLKFAPGKYKRPEYLDKFGVAFAMQPEAEGNNFLVGTSRNFDGYRLDTELEVIQAIAKRANRFFPVLKDVSCIRTYAGLRPFMPDHLPVISDVPEIPGYYIATGHEGDGISMSPMTGELISQIINHDTPSMDIKPYSFSRLKDAFY